MGSKSDTLRDGWIAVHYPNQKTGKEL